MLRSFLCRQIAGLEKSRKNRTCSSRIIAEICCSNDDSLIWSRRGDSQSGSFFFFFFPNCHPLRRFLFPAQSHAVLGRQFREFGPSFWFTPKMCGNEKEQLLKYDEQLFSRMAPTQQVSIEQHDERKLYLFNYIYRRKRFLKSIKSKHNGIVNACFPPVL